MDTEEMIGRSIDLLNTSYQHLVQAEIILKEMSNLGIVSMDKIDLTMETFLPVKKMYDEINDDLEKKQSFIQLPLVYAPPNSFFEEHIDTDII